jgi:hypothetical protein
VIALAATLHDATGALVPLIRRVMPSLATLYPGGVAVATSPPTHPRVVDVLRAAGAFAGTPSANARGPLYRLSVRGALAAGSERVHYLDFDRAVHWAAERPRELAAVLRLARRVPMLLVGRTERAHRSHHRPLYATEVVVNRLLADRLGWDGRVDFFVPSFVVEREAACTLLRRSHARDESLYGEWAAILATLVPTVSYLECNGLDWETPDRHRRAVGRVGLTAWRTRQETAAEWKLRIAMAESIVRGFERVLAGVVTPLASLARVRRPAERSVPRRLQAGSRSR